MLTLIVNNNACLILQKPFIRSDILQGSEMENKEEEQLFSSITPTHNEFYRDIFEDIYQENAPMYFGYYGASAYNSMIDGNLHKWLKRDYNILNMAVSTSRYANFDDRLYLEEAFGVKYIVARKGSTISPYGYTLKGQTKNFFIYENQHNIGFDLWYTSITNKQAYDKMNYAQRDAMLLQTAMVDKNIEGLSSYKPANKTTELKLDWSGITMENAKYSNGVVTAGKNAVLNIPINNIYKNKNGEVLFTMVLKPRNGQMVELNINGKHTTKQSEDYKYIYPICSYTFCFDGKTTELKMNISEGTYTISNAHAWFNSYDGYVNMVNDRNKYNLENLYVNGGTVSGTIKNNEKGILALNIPFSKGWSAKVDGKKQELIKVNGVFTGLVLQPGNHKIQLHYITPGLIPGACISGFTILMIICLCILNRIKAKNKIRYQRGL